MVECSTIAMTNRRIMRLHDCGSNNDPTLHVLILKASSTTRQNHLRLSTAKSVRSPRALLLDTQFVYVSSVILSKVFKLQY